MDRVPPEVKEIICSFLDGRSKLVARLASTEWFTMIGYDDFTFYAITDGNLPQVVERMELYSNPIGITFNNSFFTKMDLLRLTNLTKLAGSLSIDWIHLTKLTSLEQMNVHFRYRAPNYTVLYNHLSNITQVQEDEESVPAISSLKKLRSLNFSTMSEERDVHLFEYLACPGELTNLDFSSIGSVVMNHDIVRRLTQLKILDWCCDFAKQIFPHSLVPCLENLRNLRTPSDRIDLNVNLTSLEFCSPEYADQLIHCTKLKRLDLDYNSRSEGFQSFEYLTALRHLEYLSITGSNPGPVDIVQYIMTTNLTSFSVSNITFSERISRLTSLHQFRCDGGSEMAWLSCLTNLTRYSTYNCFDEEYFVSSFTRLEYLQICPIRGRIMMDLSNSTNLMHLGVRSGTSDHHINGMQYLTRLKSLFFGVIPGTDLDASFISRLKNLKRLWIKNQPTRGLWDAVALLPSLIFVSIVDVENENDVISYKSKDCFEPVNLTGNQRLLLSILK